MIMFGLFCIINLCSHMFAMNAIALQNLNPSNDMFRNTSMLEAATKGPKYLDWGKAVNVNQAAAGPVAGLGAGLATAAVGGLIDKFIADDLRKSGPVGEFAMDALCAVISAGCPPSTSNDDLLKAINGLEDSLDEINGVVTDTNTRVKDIEKYLVGVKSEMQTQFTTLSRQSGEQHAVIFREVTKNSKLIKDGFQGVTNHLHQINDALSEAIAELGHEESARACLDKANFITTRADIYLREQSRLAAATDLNAWLEIKKVWFTDYLDHPDWKSTPFEEALEGLYKCISPPGRILTSGFYGNFLQLLEKQKRSAGDTLTALAVAQTWFADLFNDANVLLQVIYGYQWRQSTSMLTYTHEHLADHLVKQDEAYRRFWQTVETYIEDRNLNCPSYVQNHEGHGYPCSWSGTSVYDNFGCFHLEGSSSSSCTELQPFGERYEELRTVWNDLVTASSKSGVDGSIGIFYIDGTIPRGCSIDLGHRGKGRYFNRVVNRDYCWGM